MKYCAFLMFCALLLPNLAQAATCYPAAVQEAEQLVRLHSELMVVTLSCRTTSDGTPLPPAYRQFTVTYLEKIKEAERLLMDWHRQHEGGNGTAKLDRMRTEFGNEYSRRLAQMSPPTFCDQYRNYVVKAASFTPDDLKTTLYKMRADYHGRVPACPVQEAEQH